MKKLPRFCRDIKISSCRSCLLLYQQQISHFLHLIKTSYQERTIIFLVFDLWPCASSNLFFYFFSFAQLPKRIKSLFEQNYSRLILLNYLCNFRLVRKTQTNDSGCDCKIFSKNVKQFSSTYYAKFDKSLQKTHSGSPRDTM